MTNKQRQEKLDKEKWILSQEKGKDLSAQMRYCDYCESNVYGVCFACQQERVKHTLCAKAYNKYKRYNKE